MRYLIAIDQGTTSSRSLVYNERFEVVGMGQQSFPQHYPKPGWVEHDLWEIWHSVEASLKEAIKAATVADPGFDVQKIGALGITNQRETFGLWDRSSGEPLARAIVWQCRRSATICEKLKKSASGKKLPGITGLVLDPYFSGTKLKWALDNNATWRRRAQKGEVAFGTMDTYLIWKLSAGRAHVTDISNASRTLLMDLKKGEWSTTCLKTLGIPRSLLPKILDSDAFFGETQGLSFLPDGIPIHGVLGDQQAALFGQECFTPGEAKVTYGTGAFLLLNTGNKIRRTQSGLSTVAWRLRGKTTYALEGSVFIAGAAVQWLRDGINLVQKSGEIEGLARQVEDTDGVFMIPALTGLGSPYWVPQARGIIGGITRGTKKAHIARACLEAIASSVAELFENLQKDSGLKLRRLRVDGGASQNSLLLRMQSDLTGVIVERPRDVESTARGAVYIAALGAGFISNEKKLAGINPVDVELRAQMSLKNRKEKMNLWKRRIKALLAGCY